MNVRSSIARLAAALVACACLGFPARAEEDAAKKCDLRSPGGAGWKCTKCEVIHVEGTVEGNQCPDCKTEMINVPLCMKAGFKCEKDGVCQAKAGKCPKCAADLVETPVPSEIYYRCPKCEKRDPAGRPGECPACKVFRVKTCALSGTCPHLPTPKETEGDGDGGGDGEKGKK